MKLVLWMRAGLALAALGSAGTALAHHSAAMFDRSKPYTVSGTLKEIVWANPHIWVTLTVPDGKGGADDYRYEGGSPAGVVRSGMTKKDFKPGAKMKFIIAPYRDGSRRGEFMAAWTADGRQVTF